MSSQLNERRIASVSVRVLKDLGMSANEMERQLRDQIRGPVRIEYDMRNDCVDIIADVIACSLPDPSIAFRTLELRGQNGMKYSIALMPPLGYSSMGYDETPKYAKTPPTRSKTLLLT